MDIFSQSTKLALSKFARFCAKFRWEITFSALHPFLAPIRRPSLIFAILDFLTQYILAELDSLTAKTLKKTPCSQIPLSEGTSRLKNPFCLNFGGRLRKLWMGTLETFQNWWSLVENIQFDTDCTWMNILQSKVHWEYVYVFPRWKIHSVCQFGSHLDWIFRRNICIPGSQKPRKRYIIYQPSSTEY